MNADGFISCIQSENGIAVEMFAEDGKALCKKHIKAALNKDDVIQVGRLNPLSLNCWFTNAQCSRLPKVSGREQVAL
jgi:hypothetical protein